MLPSRLKTHPNSLLKLSVMTLVVAILSGCGEDAKDCGGFWDKTFGREACSKSIVSNGGSQLPVNTVTVELSAKATTGKKLEIVSSIDGSVANASNQAIVTSKSRDTLLAIVDDKIYLKALKYNDTPVKLTPASTAVYLVLQLKGMIQLPDNQLPKAIAAVESHTGYKDLVSYIDYKVNMGYADPINVELDYALMSLVIAIAKDIKPEDYLNTVAEWSPVKQYVAKQTTSLDVGDVLLMIVGIQPTYAGDEATTLGNSELKVGQPNPNVKFTNYTFNPYFAYLDDGAASGKWNYIAGKDSIFSFSFDLTKTSAAASIKDTDSKEKRYKKYMQAFYQAATDSIKTGNQETTLTLAGVTAAGNHHISVESMGICQLILPGLGIPSNQASAQQVASSLMNMVSLYMVLAEVAVGAQELKKAQDELTAELAKPEVMKQTVNELAKVKDALDKAKVSVEATKTAVKRVRLLSKFIKAFMDEVIKIKTEKKLNISNDILLLRGLVSSSDSFLELAGDFVEANSPEEDKAFLKDLLSALGEKAQEGVVENIAESIARTVYDSDNNLDLKKKFNENLLTYLATFARSSDVIDSFHPKETEKFKPLAAIDAVLHNEFLQTLIGKLVGKATNSLILDPLKKTLVEKTLLKHAKEANVAAKAASLTWGIGTKALPMFWDSCTISNKLSIAVNNGKVSNYTEPKADFWIEDATGKVVYWFNDTSGTEQKSGTTVALIPNKQYTFHVKSKQEGILDYSRESSSPLAGLLGVEGRTDAVHQTNVDGFRAPVKVYSISLAQQTDQKLEPMLNVQLCARRSSRDFNIGSRYALSYFVNGSASFTCVHGAGEFTTAESLPFVSANGSIYNGVTYNNVIFAEALAYSLVGTEWSELYEKYKDYGFGGQSYYKKTFVATENLKSFTLNIDGFNSEYPRTFKIDVINGSEALIDQLTNNNSELTINDKVKFALGAVAGNVKNVRWTLVDSTGKVVSGPTSQLPTASEEFVMPAAGKYTVQAELLNDKGTVTGKSTLEFEVKSPVYDSVSVSKIPVGQPVTITVTGNLPPTSIFTLAGATCSEPLFKNNVPFIGDTLTEVCTVSSAKDNIPLTVKQKATDESGIVFTLAAVDTLTVSGRFVLDAKNGSKDIFGDHHLYFSPPVDQIKDVNSTTGDILGYSRSRKDMECTFKPASNAKVGASPDKPLTDANGYATNISPFLNGFAHMALITGGNQLIGIDGATFAIPARQTLWLKVNDDVFEDNVGHFNIDYTCWESALAIQPLATEPIVGTQAIFSLSNLIIDGVKSVVWKVGEAVVSVFDGINNVFGHKFDAVGDFVVSATVKDANDNEITTVSTTINVKPLVCPEGQVVQDGKCVDSTTEPQPTWKTNPTNGHQYAAVDCGTWTQCEAQAVALGAHLVSVNDAAENSWLVSTFTPTKNYWIGLTDKDQEGVWKWTSGEAFGYSNWISGEPSNGGGGTSAESYVHMNFNYPSRTNVIGKWNDTQNDITGTGIGGIPYNSSAMGIFEKSSGITATISASSTAPVAGTAVTFNLIDTVVDGIKSVVWKVGDTVVKVLASIADAFEYIFDKSGTYTITASLKDVGDQVVLAPSLSVKVASQPPVASLVGSSMTSTVGQSVNFVLSGSKANEGKLCSYSFDNGQGLDAGGSIDCTDTSKTLPLNTINMQYTAIGTYTAKLTVTDSQGKSATTTWLVNVGEAPQIADTGKLNDTGITQCATNNTFFGDCSADSLGNWFGLNQDAEFGRDALAVKNLLVKEGGGDAGFDFTKISATGQKLPANAAEWSCVLDNRTGFMWEIKTDDGGLRDKDNLYSWYNPNSSVNGGNAGSENSSNNTYIFTQNVNQQNLCGHNDWHLPSKKELLSIVHYGKSSPALDVDYFPNTKSYYYWSSSPNAGASDFAWTVHFRSGVSSASTTRSSANYVRLVRLGQ